MATSTQTCFIHYPNSSVDEQLIQVSETRYRSIVDCARDWVHIDVSPHSSIGSSVLGTAVYSDNGALQYLPNLLAHRSCCNKFVNNYMIERARKRCAATADAEEVGYHNTKETASWGFVYTVTDL